MASIRELLILSTALTLLVVTLGLSLISLTSGQVRVVNAFAVHEPRPAVILVLEVNGVVGINEVVVEGVRVPVGATLVNGRYVLLVSGSGDVRVFRDTMSALGYLRSSAVFMGSPFPRKSVYSVSLVLSDGTVLRVKAPVYSKVEERGQLG